MFVVLSVCVLIGQVWCLEKTAFLMVDVQNCFLPNGTLAVNEGDQVIPIINRIRQNHRFDLYITSQDWHCIDHISFASQFAEEDPFQNVILQYSDTGILCNTAAVSGHGAVQCPTVGFNVTQMLWPDHCVQNTQDAKLNEQLVTEESDVIIRKGNNCQVDSYSVFRDNLRLRQTGFKEILDENGITVLFIAGLARDYCVHWTAQDSVDYGYKTYVVLDATRSVSPVTGEAAVNDMIERGIILVQSSDIGDALEELSASRTHKINASVPFIFLFLCTYFLDFLHM